MVFLITTSREVERDYHEPGQGATAGVFLEMVDQTEVATLDERALLLIADAAAEASPDTGEGGAWDRRSDAVRGMRYDLDRIEEGDLSDWKDGVTADEARAYCRADLERWIAEWTGWIPSEAGGTIPLPDGTVIEVRS